MTKKIGIEAAYGFGDNLFNAPLIKAIKNKYQDSSITVAVQSQCADAFYNLEWIDEIQHIKNLNQGISNFINQKFDYIFQITQNVLFLEYRLINKNHSLIDTPSWFAANIGIKNYDQRPIFNPTDQEVHSANQYLKTISQPLIAIESIAKSSQSWIDQAAIDMIVDKYKDTHKILWLSNENCPKHPNIDDMLNFSRRELIMMLKACEKFFTTGSGFFCSALALKKENQPKKIVALWKDDFYKYENRLGELKYHDSIEWTHNHQELKRALLD